MSGRAVRIFLSSTFRDFGEERDLLVRQLFPTLRARLQPHFFDLIDVDLIDVDCAGHYCGESKVW